MLETRLAEGLSLNYGIKRDMIVITLERLFGVAVKFINSKRHDSHCLKIGP